MGVTTQLDYSLAEAINQAWGIVMNSQSASEPWDPDVRIGTANGYRCIEWESGPSGGGPTDTTRYLFAPLGADQTCTVRWMIALGVLSGIDSYNPLLVGKPTMSAMQGYWEALFLPVIQDILETWCAASVEAGDTFGIDFAGDRYRSVAMYWRVTTDAEVFVISRNLAMAEPPLEEPDVGKFVIGPSQSPIPASSVAVVPGSSSTAELARIGDLIGDLAHRSVVQSINNGSAVADLATGDVTT